MHATFLDWIYLHGGFKGFGPWYGFWSGSGSDIAEFGLIFVVLGAIGHQARIHNCETHGCWRLGLHKTAAGHRVCRKHHPDDPLTHQDILEAHNAALGA